MKNLFYDLHTIACLYSSLQSILKIQNQFKSIQWFNGKQDQQGKGKKELTEKLTKGEMRWVYATSDIFYSNLFERHFFFTSSFAPTMFDGTLMILQ